MGDEILEYLRGWEARLRGLKKEKKNIIRAISILILSMGVFFYPTPSEISVAKSTKPKDKISLGELVPDKKIGNYVYKNRKDEEKSGIASCAETDAGVSKKENKGRAVYAMVSGHPIEEMIPYIEKRDKEVASFLVAIAKKESDWGIYSPKKAGKDCFNYWGFKGAYNLTESGYSCFDSPEQAVRIVGDRIEKLLKDKIDTPGRMVVWKCGSTCAGHDPAGVAKWISDVALYYGKLNS
jgi:hypothetical protein